MKEGGAEGWGQGLKLNGTVMGEVVFAAGGGVPDALSSPGDFGAEVSMTAAVAFTKVGRCKLTSV